MARLIGNAFAACVECSSSPHDDVKKGVRWSETGESAAFPSPLEVHGATAIATDATRLYWISTDGFLYRAPRSGGGIARVALPTTGAPLLAVHNDVYVGWTDADGHAAIADIDPATGTVTTVSHQPDPLRALVGGQRGYGFAVTTPDGTRIQACLDSVCSPPSNIASPFKSLALDLPTKTYYVLTEDGLRTCSLRDGCPAVAATAPATAALVATLPGMHFLLDANGQLFANDGSTPLGSAAVPGPIKFMVDDGNGKIPNLVGTWSNGAQLAQRVLTPQATTTVIDAACSDFDDDATGRPIYCLVGGGDTIEVIP